MSAIQLNFTLRTTSQVKTVHLLGSWDNYHGQLPMSRDPSKAAGAWVGTFRFQPGTLNPGQRYWYYYTMDGYHVTHDPAKEFTVEPTTQRKLNILDVPGSRSSKRDSTLRSSKRHSKRESADYAKGRSLSPSQIRSPRPVKPGQTAHIVAEAYDQSAVADLQYRFSHARIDESSDDDSSDDDSDISSNVPSLTSASSRSSNNSSPSSCSSSCTCERYGITRTGNRVKLDCGGARCGYGESASSCSDDSDGEYRRGMTRRHGVVIRG